MSCLAHFTYSGKLSPEDWVVSQRELVKRKLAVGAEPRRDGGVHFRVWAPATSKVSVELQRENGKTDLFPLTAEENGYFSGLLNSVHVGDLYKFRLDSGAFPDPASRFQPEGPHGPSQVIDPSIFKWTDEQWRGFEPKDIVLYEMHIGTFTSEGTWQAAMEHIPDLKHLGITALEIMPIADFPGRFGWGYDGVDLFAPTRLYGNPDDVRRFVNRAHEIGLMVLLDVVYNHVGPDGNYLPQFSKDYFSAKYKCEWGEAINFDGENAGPVREFFISNARYWIDEFHFDGVRLDATQQIFDDSKTHIIAEISKAARAAARQRPIYIVAENEPQETRLVRSYEASGYGLDSLWNDDYHHSAIVAATGRSEAYYSDYKGTPQEFISSAKYGYLYQGQWYKWQQKRRGTPAFDLSPKNFVVFVQNHDQIANSLRGVRLHQLTSPGTLKALTALTLLHPSTPMIFQGDEFSASTPFLYFADHNDELNKMVSKGRAEFLHQFRSIASDECRQVLADPGQIETFVRCKLDATERRENLTIGRMYADLLRIRREDEAIHDPEFVDGAVLSPDAFVLRYFSAVGDDRLLLVNLGKDLQLNPAPEPLLAPLENHGWRVLWSSESVKYGGCGTPPLETRANWMLPGHSAVLMEPDEQSLLPKVKLSQND
jgi:maltooligosyltrehalose trehalohydrolase